MQITVQEIASLVQGKVVGDGRQVITGITNIETPAAGQITFLQDPRNLAKLEATEIAAILAPLSVESSSKTIVQVKEPKLAWAKLLTHFYPAPVFAGEVSDRAFVAPGVILGKNVRVEAFAYIASGAVIGDDTVVRTRVFIGENVKIGRRTLLHPGVSVYRDTVIGDDVIVHSGSVIGADGFGYVHTQEGQYKIPQVGNVVIGNRVELGACVTIDRATMGSTTLGDGCKIDNLVQIAHNVSLGPHTVISSQTGVSGSSKIGAHVTMGGKVGVGDHVEIGDWTMVGAGAGLPTGKKVPGGIVVFGEPARPYEQARKQIAAQLRSAEMYDEIKKLRKRVEELEKKNGSSIGS